VSTTTSAPPLTIPGTDAQGFVDYQGARCDVGNSPAALARTTQSVLVVCRSGPGDFYYRGVRLSDGAGIELANAVRSSGGFDVTNPTDGTRYQIRPDSLTIIPPGSQAITEPMVAYAAR
jgi:serine/threonine-protein kinase